MKTLEYCLTCFSIAGILYVLTLWQPTQHPALLAAPHEQMLCPDLVIKHSVRSNLTTGVEVRDACAETVNVIKY